MRPGSPLRLLIVPGLHDSGPAHWQSWLQARHPGSVRVQQRDWNRPALDEWADRIDETLADAGHGAGWLAAAHSFGCLALVRHLQRNPASPVRAALLVAPADPLRFDVASQLPQAPLRRPTTWVASSNDPWMDAGTGQAWARRWGCHRIDLGAAGHINVDAGFGPLPLAARWVRTATQKLQRARRAERAAFGEWSFAV